MSKKQALLNATQELLWERGYSATSPRDILARSGAGQGSFYHHFSGKKQLAVSALEELQGRMIAVFERLFRDDDYRRSGLLERFERVLVRPYGQDVLRGCPLGGMAGDVAIADAELREPVARYFRHLQTALAAALREAAAAGEIRLQTDPEAIAVALIAAVQGGYVISRVHDEPAYFDLAVQSTLTMFRQYVARPRAERARFMLPVAALGV